MTSPENISHALTAILPTVAKPAQYLGNEVNAVRKDFAAQKLRVVLIFPDAYEMGMSHMGLKILYSILNKIDGVVAERCFAPLPDFEKKLRDYKVPLTSLESKTPLSEFDIIGVSIPYELTFTNLLNILDLGGVPVWAKERGENMPLVLAGGTGAYNPEPIADFLDAVALGDGEELILDVVRDMLAWKTKHGVDQISKNQTSGSRRGLFETLSKIEGMYIPSLFEPEYFADGRMSGIKPMLAGYTGVKKRIVQNLDEQPYPTDVVVPNVKLIHDRIGIEIQRGCTRMCRFCQAGYIDRPTRQRSPEKVLEIAEDSLKQTGISEISLLSLSAGDYQTIVPTLKELNARYADKKVSISVPATRTETLTPELISEIKTVRRTGFTIAPEAGSERMRRVINKGNKVEDLMQACRNAFAGGYRLIKFYYMCGLPFETDADVLGIAEEARQALSIGREYTRAVEINVSVSSFVPKPFTPFQWEPQVSNEEVIRKHDLVKRALKDKALRFKCHEPPMSLLEGLFARGDRRLSKVVYRAFENGCRFDEWGEHLDFAKWQKTFEETQVDLDFYLNRRRERDEILPWDHLFTQMKKEWLWEELEAARTEAYVADCSVDKCASFCGVCDFKVVKNKIYVLDDNALAAKKGNREWYGRFGKDSPHPAPVAHVPVVEPTAEDRANRQRLRVRFSKVGPAAFFGHLELMLHLKRAIERTGADPAYSEGFHPQMKLAMGYALPLGLESECEEFDLVLRQALDPNEFLEKLNTVLPGGLVATAVESIDLRAPSIYSQVESVLYHVDIPDNFPELIESALKGNIEKLKAGENFNYVRQRPGRGESDKSFRLDDCLDLSGTHFVTPRQLALTTLCRQDGSLKPIEALRALSGGTDQELATVRVKKVGVKVFAASRE